MNKSCFKLSSLPFTVKFYVGFVLFGFLLMGLVSLHAYIKRPEQMQSLQLYEQKLEDVSFKKVSEINLDKADLWEEKIPCDILILTSSDPKVVIGHRMADCPVLIIEDKVQKAVAVSHCGASQINRKVPFYTEECLIKEYNSKKEDLYAYIGSCIKKDSYIYDQYPKWATNKEVWKDCLNEENGLYHIDLVTAIKNQLIIDESHITVSPIDTYKDQTYYSHTSEVKKEEKPIGQNFVGCFYNDKK